MATPLHPAVTFPWNWVDEAIAINRSTLANHFCNQLASYVPKYCIVPSIAASYFGVDSSITFSWKLTPSQIPTVTTWSLASITASPVLTRLAWAAPRKTLGSPVL
jgi:hypothetical protein